MSGPERYPLCWPTGWKRTRPAARQRAKFSAVETRYSDGGAAYTNRRSLTVSDARARLDGELRRLGAANLLISTNVVLRLDGLPRSGQGEPQDPGAAVYFQLEGKPRCLASDRWKRVADNLAAIAGHVAALRTIDRYGVGTMEQAFAGYAQLPPAATEWWVVLGLPPDAPRADIELAHRNLARRHHPDVGGSVEQMARINAARDAALEGRP